MPSAPSEDDLRALELLRSKGLSIRGLDPERRRLLSSFFLRNHVENGVSLSDIAKLVGNKTSGYASYACRELGVKARPFEEARLRGIREKRRKHERRPFDGTEEEKAYMLGIRFGDLHAYPPWKGVVRVSTSTTHPAMANLFTDLFGGYGDVYMHPRYKSDTDTYEWNLQAILDGSFDFLLQSIKDALKWVSASRSRLLHFLAGLFDAEGSIGVHPAKRLVSIRVAYYNTNLGLLKFVHRSLLDLGYHPLAPYLDKRKGFRSPGYKIEMKKDYWRVLLVRFVEVQSFLSEVRLMHREKLEKSSIAHRVKLGDEWESVRGQVEGLRAQIRQERDAFVGIAQTRVEERRRLTARNAKLNSESRRGSLGS